MEPYVNVEQLIAEVHKRPLLWDSSNENYKYKTWTKAAWMDICAIVIPDFDKLGSREQQINAARINHKWRNIRDNFTRDLRLRQDGNCCKKRRYIFADRLDFLLKEKLKKGGETAGNDSSSNSEADHVTDQDSMYHSSTPEIVEPFRPISKVEKDETYDDPLMAFDDVPLDDHSTPPSCSNSVDNSIPQTSITNYPDEDKLFFESLLPTVRTLDTDAKLEFRIEALNILRRLKRKQV